MILNDKQKNQKLINLFESHLICNSNITIERLIKRELNPEEILAGVRIEYRKFDNLAQYDYIRKYF